MQTIKAEAQSEVQKLASLAKRWGGELVPTHPHDWDTVTRKYKDFTNAPFTHRELGISFRARTICYDPEDVYWPELLHEFGHVFAAGQPPKETDEGDWFGWQFALARYIKADVEELREDNQLFYVGWASEAPYYPEWQRELKIFTLKEQRAIIRHAVRVSKDLGIVTERGRPLPNFKRLRKP